LVRKKVRPDNEGAAGPLRVWMLLLSLYGTSILTMQFFGATRVIRAAPVESLGLSISLDAGWSRPR
jgi:hypothetical protein